MSESKSESILRVSNLTKIYGNELKIGKKIFGRKIIGAKDVSFDVKKGEIFGFLGPNGAGKTTTIRAILNYLRIENGNISIFDLDHRKDAIEIRKNIGYIPGDIALYENFTGNELLRYFNNFRPIDFDFLAELQKIFKVDLTLKIKALSKGNRQQIGLLLALAPKPDLLILDEPSSGLDPLMTVNFHRILRKLKSEETTIFLSSHDLAEVQTICDRVGIIKDGSIVLVENIDNLKVKFLQHVTIKFRNEFDLPGDSTFIKLDCVIELSKINDRVLKLKVKENIDGLLKLLTNFEIERLTIEDATLEEIFLHYYE